MKTPAEFDELMFFGRMKARYGAHIGKKSILSLRDYIGGMEYAFWLMDGTYGHFKYFGEFIDWYAETYIQDRNGYAAWWNHLLYTSGNFDNLAFDAFYGCFESFLEEVHHRKLPEPAFP